MNLFKAKSLKFVVFSLILMMAASFQTLNISALEKVTMNLVYDGKKHSYTNYKITLNINGKPLTGLDMPPVILNDRLYVPVRYVFEAMGGIVDYNDESKRIYIGHYSDLIMLQLNSQELNINGNKTEMEVPPKVINDRTMVPVRFVAESLDFKVDWDDKLKTVYITGKTPGQATGKPAPTASPTAKPAAPTAKPTAAPTVRPTVAPTAAPTVKPTEALTVAPTAKPTAAPTPKPTPKPTNKPSGITANATPKPPQTENDTSNSTDNEKPEPLLPGSKPKSSSKAIDVSTSAIPIEENEETGITDILLPSPTNPSTYTIQASSRISRVDKMLLEDNRIVIDIYNAEAKLFKNVYEVDSLFLKSIRGGQNQITPTKITRIVFDLTSSVSFGVSISEDRKSVLVDFMTNTITDVSFSSDSSGDSVVITGLTPPQVSTFPLQGPNRIVVEMPLASIELPSEKNVNGKFAKTIRSAQYDKDLARVVIDLEKYAEAKVTTEGNKTIIKLATPTYKGIYYNEKDHTIVLTKTDTTNFPINQITQKDEYLDDTYTFTLPGKFETEFGYGKYYIRDSFIESIALSHTDGETKIIVSENKILAFDMKEDNNNYYFKVLSPKDKYPHVVFIDPGHGANDPGASGLYGMTEKDINLDVALRLKELIERDGRVKAYFSRTGDMYPTRDERAKKANATADLFVSLHHNTSTSLASGSEVYYYTHGNDSSFSVSSKEAAEIFYGNMVSDLDSGGRSYKSAKFEVLKRTTIPAVLVEIGFMDNPNDARKIKTPEYRQRAAESIYRSILETFGISRQ